jgi:hypothetical protein
MCLEHTVDLGIYGGSRFKRIPTASSSASKSALCSAFLVASSIIRMRSLVYDSSMGFHLLTRYIANKPLLQK